MMSLYRSLAFMHWGSSAFTKEGYLKQAAKFTPRALDVDLTHKVFAVTGANSGIGYEMARSFLLRGGEVHLICRDATRANEARLALLQELQQQQEQQQQEQHQQSSSSPPPSSSPTTINDIPLSLQQRCQVHILDISDIAMVKTFASAWNASNRPLHVLVNNAGCMVHERRLTREGFEFNFATNVLGTYTLTNELLPVLRAQSHDPTFIPKVIMVSSGGMYSQRLQLDDFNHDKGFTDATPVYARHKRMQVALVEALDDAEITRVREQQLQHRQQTRPPITCAEPERVTFHAMHPGWADTPAVRTAMPGFHSWMKDKLRTPQQGADTAVWLAIAAPTTVYLPQAPSGQFWLDRTVQPKHMSGARTSYDRSQAHELLKKVHALQESIASVADKVSSFSFA